MKSPKNESSDADALKPREVHTLCGVQGCCPTVSVFDDNSVEITDDFGGKVKLSSAEFQELQGIKPA